MSERFKLAHASKLQPDLAVVGDASRIRKSNKARKAALKSVVANMTMNNAEMIQLFPEIIQCMALPDVEIKRMCFLFVETYAKARPHHALEAMAQLRRDIETGPSGMIRALALRTLSSVASPEFVHETISLAQDGLKDTDPYMRKTAAFAVAKAWTANSKAVEESGLLSALNKLLVLDTAPMVVSAAVEALNEITSHTSSLKFVVDGPTAMALARILPKCSEWAKAGLLSALMQFIPETHKEARDLYNLVIAQAQNTNSAVTLGVVRLVIYLSNYSEDVDVPHVLTGPLLAQLQRPPEIRHVILRSVLLLAQKWPEVFVDHLKQFYCSVQEPEYIHLAKIQILSQLATSKNYRVVLAELREVASQGKGKSGKRAIIAIQSIAVRLEETFDSCASILLNLMDGTDVPEECAISLVEILRRYPQARNREDIVKAIWQQQVSQRADSKEALVAFLWLLGYAPTMVPDSVSWMSKLIDSWDKLDLDVQLAALTAGVKLWLVLPAESSGILPHILDLAISDSVDPDLRDRALFYRRLYDSVGANGLNEIVGASLPPTEQDRLLIDDDTLEELELNLGYLSAVYLKSAGQLFRVAKIPTLPHSPALLPRRHRYTESNSQSVESVLHSNTKVNLPAAHRALATSPKPSHATPRRAPSVLFSRTASQSESPQSRTVTISEEDERLIDF